MKHKLTLIGCLIGLISHAQYFEGRYGTAVQEEVGSGAFTQMTGSGHILSGQRVNSLASELVLIRTDAAGVVPATLFRNRYKMYSNSTMVQPYDVQQSVVVELDNNSFGVVGTCGNVDLSNPGQEAIYFAIFNATGGYVLSNIYMTANNSLSYEIKGARLANSGTELYVTGMVTEAAQSYAVVMKLDIATGTPLWAWSYMVDPTVASGEPECGYDLVENPDLGELLVVGFRHVCTNTSDDAWIMRLDPSTGLPSNPTRFYGDNNAIDVFTSIEMKDSGKGFYVGGWSSVINGVLDNWTMSFDNNFNVNWSTTHDYSNAIVPNYSYDIKPYTDSDGNTWLYSMGRTETGVMGQDDIEVYQIDANNGMAVRQFTYGTIRDEYAFSMDRNISGVGGDGLSIYGMRDGGATSLFDLIIVKTDFNGFVPCNKDDEEMRSDRGPDLLYEVEPVIIDEFNVTENFMQLSGQVGAAINCSTEDQRFSPASGGTAVSVQQSASGTDCQLQVKTQETQLLTVELRDLKGSVLKAFGTRRVEAGQVVLDFDLSGLGLSAGMYMIHWSDGVCSGGEKVIVR